MTTEQVEILERTGGTGGATKWIPYPARLRSEFAEAVGVWMVDLHRHRPDLLGTRSYWSVSRATRRPEATTGGLKVGFDDDAEYFGPVARRAIGRLMAVPGDVAQSPTLDAWRQRTATHLIERADLGLISVWSPTFLTRLMSWISAHREELAKGLSAEPQRRLHRAGLSGEVVGSLLWPHLRVISAWGDGFAAGLVRPMMARFPGVEFQAKGVLATEGVLSFPLIGRPGGALAVTSHVIELRDIESGAALWAHEAREGARYQPLLTTGGGLVRYALPDIVEVVGFVGQVPLIRLVGRTDKASDMVGEKLTEEFVDQVFDRLWDQRPPFAMLLPTERPHGYVLVVDGEAPAAEAVDQALREAYHYDYARDLEQLAPVRVYELPDAWSRWESAIEGAGLLLGDQKPGALELRTSVAAALLSTRGRTGT